MSRYRFLVTDLVTGEIRDEVPFSTVTFDRMVSGAAPFQATIGVHEPKATRALLDPARTVVHVERDGRIVADGVIWPSQVQPSESDERTLELGGSGLWSYFRRRTLTTTLSWEQVDQLQVFRDVIGWAQSRPGVDIGIQLGDETSTVLRDDRWHWFKVRNIGTALQLPRTPPTSAPAIPSWPAWRITAGRPRRCSRRRRARSSVSSRWPTAQQQRTSAGNRGRSAPAATSARSRSPAWQRRRTTGRRALVAVRAPTRSP